MNPVSMHSRLSLVVRAFPYALFACALFACDADGGADAGDDVDAGDVMDGSTPRDAGDTDTDAGEPGEDAGPPSTDFFHTCGSGGGTEEWVSFEVAYPAGTMLDDGTEVTTARYEVWAPPPRAEPYPLIIAMHGDNGDPGATRSDWRHLLPNHEFILVTPQEPHQEVDGGQSHNGWDNFPSEGRRFLYNMLDDIGGRYDIDIDRIYATGASAGSWFGGQMFFTMQDVFAAVQLSCGGASSTGYREPSEPTCLTPARFETAPSDFLYGAARATHDSVQMRGHEVEFHETECNGHCCGQREDYGDAAWEFFRARPYCGGGAGRTGCGTIPTP